MLDVRRHSDVRSKPKARRQKAKRQTEISAFAPHQIIVMEGEALKPGQKHPTPTPGNGDRVFYETLYRQRPDSEMAQEWCVLQEAAARSLTLDFI